MAFRAQSLQTVSSLKAKPDTFIAIQFLKIGRIMRILKVRSLLLVVSLSIWLVACQSTPITSSSEQGVVRVVTSGGFAAAYNILEPEFEKLTGLDLQTSYGSSSGGAHDSIPMRLNRGEAFDVIILSRGSLDKRTAEGFVDADTRVDLVRSLIGMAVKEGAEKPDISTPEKFIAALMQAESIGYSASASGTYLSTVLLPKMQLWDALQEKSTRILSERVATVVARGDVEIGFQQVSEILPIEGVDYVGPIPDELQKVTTFSAGITNAAVNRSGAERLLEYLSSIDVSQTIADTGLDPVVLEK